MQPVWYDTPVVQQLFHIWDKWCLDLAIIFMERKGKGGEFLKWLLAQPKCSICCGITYIYLIGYFFRISHLIYDILFISDDCWLNASAQFVVELQTDWRIKSTCVCFYCTRNFNMNRALHCSQQWGYFALYIYIYKDVKRISKII